MECVGGFATMSGRSQSLPGSSPHGVCPQRIRLPSHSIVPCRMYPACHWRSRIGQVPSVSLGLCCLASPQAKTRVAWIVAFGWMVAKS